MVSYAKVEGSIPSIVTKHTMTVGDLKKKLEDVDDDLEIVAMGYFGEGIRYDTYGWDVRSGVGVCNYNWEWREAVSGPKQKVFVIPSVDIGEIPD